MTRINEVLCDYIDRLHREADALQSENAKLKKLSSQSGDIKKAIHDASNVIGQPVYSIGEPDGVAVAWVEGVMREVILNREKIKDLELELEGLRP